MDDFRQQKSVSPYSVFALRYPLVDNFGTFEWPNASDLEELVVESRT